jgi:hypothetical protein
MPNVDRQGELIVLLMDVLDQLLAVAGATGVEFQQTVTAAVQLAFQA